MSAAAHPHAVDSIPTAAPAPSPADRDGWAGVDLLLRDSRHWLDGLGDKRSSLVGATRSSLIALIVCGAIFGAALGSYRGGEQLLYAAIKLPLLLLGVAVLTIPALAAVRRALYGQTDLARDFAVSLAAMARSAMVMAALAPIVVLAGRYEVGYHQTILTVTAISAAAGFVGMSFIGRGMRQDDGGWLRRLTATCVMLLLVTLVGGQLAWSLRPWVVRPRAEIEFTRAVEGSLIEAIDATMDSAHGIYHRERAPLPGERW